MSGASGKVLRSTALGFSVFGFVGVMMTAVEAGATFRYSAAVIVLGGVFALLSIAFDLARIAERKP